MSLVQFLDGTTIASVLGSVIPSIIGLAIYLCNFYLKIKQKGWRNLNEQDWRDLGLQIEKEFNLVSSVLSSNKEHHCCEHCQKPSEQLTKQVQALNVQINKSKGNLMQKANDKVEENKTPEVKK